MKKIINIDNIVSITLITLIIFMPLTGVIDTYISSYLKLIPDALVVTLFIIVLITKKINTPIKKVDLLFILFLTIGAISTFINKYSLYTYLVQLRSITIYYFLYFILRNYLIKDGQIKKINITLKVITIILFIHSLIEIIFNKMILFPSIWASSIKYADNFTRSYGMFNNPNTFALFALMTYIFLEEKDKQKNILYKTALITIILLSMSRSTLVFFIIFILYKILFSENKIKYKLSTYLLPIIISILTVLCVTTLKNTINYKNERQNTKDDNVQINNTTNENDTSNNVIDRFEELTSNQIIESSKYNGRLYSINKGFEVLIDYPILGAGFGSYGSASSLITGSKIYDKYNIEDNFYSDNEYIKVLVETGILGFIVYIILCINIIKDNKHCLIICLIFFGYGLFLNNFEIKALCLMFYLILITNNKSNKINKNHISIYSLHLNYGGIEKNICTKANILSKKYKVEIISLYKLRDNPAFDINKNIKITYLSENIIPNKEEFKLAVKNRNIISIFKEGLKSIKILYLKNKLITKSMSNCNSEIIISTRMDFTKKLLKHNKYKNIKIAEEHVYHNNNKKYLKDLKKILKKVDYLMPSSDYLTEFYKNKYLEYSYKIKTNRMPIESDYKLSSLENKIIISVGRLSKEKGFDDLIKAFSKIENKDWILQIVGDGNEKESLLALIDELKLNDRVKILGFKTTGELNKLYKEASLYVMTSLEESFGLVLLEAASHGLPIIAYDSALGACEILKGDKGILIKNRNNKNLIESLNNITSDFELRKIYQKKSLEISKKYKQELIEKEIIDFYNNVTKSDLYTNLYKGSKKECIRELEEKLKNKEKTFVITANPETYMLSMKDKELNSIIYNSDNLIVPDGIAIVKTANYLGYNINERITGIELSEELLELANKNKYKVYLFGASENVIEKLENVIQEKYPNIKLVGATNGYIKDKETVMEYIKTTNPDIVMLALGIPQQEKLINKHIDDFKKGIFIGVGGSFDVLSGSKKRAPKIFIKYNLEWVYRIAKEPKRIIRFLKYNIKYIFKILRIKINK